jgi:sugar/nucleoside kinase (ribokinase family)
MHKPLDVAAIGHAIVDVIASVDESFLLTHNVAKGVMTLIDEYRAQTLYTAFNAPRESAGGSAANSMAGLASLGGRGAFSGKVRDDRLGQAFAAGMKERGLTYTTGMAQSGPSTGCCLIAVTGDGERSMNTYLGANRNYCLEDLAEKEIADAKVLYVEGYMWDAPSAREACRKAIAIARSVETSVAFAISDPFLVGRYREEFLDLLRGGDLDILFANEEEAKSLFETETFDQVLQHTREWGGIAALTRSEKGCVVTGKSEVHVVDAAPVARVVDTTGAGDQFAGGFLYGLTHEMTLAQCGRLGGLAAAEVISHYGARPETSLKRLAQDQGLI